MILVTGASGTVGREVVAQLLAAGHHVRALTRSASKAQFDPRVSVVEGDFSKPETLVSAVNDAERIFSLALGPNLGIHEGELVRAARRTGVRQIVKLSVLGAGGRNPASSAVVSWHNAGEGAIQASGIPFTFLRPTAFMSNALFWRDTIKSSGTVFSNFGDGKVAYIHPRDIAAVAVRALTSPGHEGKAYALTGPEALSVADQVAILSTVIGRPIQYVRVSDEVARTDMSNSGMPEYMIKALLPFAAFVRNGEAADVVATLDQVLGRTGLTFRDWAIENAAAFG
jgi:uncharacterized protein YbjT (DUF2867 family)